MSAVGRPLDTVLQGSDPSDDAQQHMRIYISSAGKALANTLAGGNDLGPSESVSMASTRDEMRFTSFDEWLASFTPRSVEGLETQTLRRAHLRDKRQKLLGQETIYSTALEAPAATVRFHVEKLRKGGMVGEESRLYHSETIDIGRDCLTFELLEQLYQKGALALTTLDRSPGLTGLILQDTRMSAVSASSATPASTLGLLRESRLLMLCKSPTARLHSTPYQDSKLTRTKH